MMTRIVPEPIKMETGFGAYDVVFDIGEYVADGSLAIKTYSYEEGPVATLTVCLDDKTLESNESYVDTNNCPWAEDFITNNGFGMRTGRVGISGFCMYPLYAFDVDALNKHAVKGI